MASNGAALTHLSRRPRWQALLAPAVLTTTVVLAVASAGLIRGIDNAAPSSASLPLTDRPEFSDALRTSLLLASVSTVIAVVAGFGIAVIIVRWRGGRLVAAAAAATIPVSHLVGATAFALLLADGALLSRIAPISSTLLPPLVAGPWWIATIAEYAWKETAFVALVVSSVLARHEALLHEAAATLGVSPRLRRLRITLPLAAPALLVTGALAFAYVLGSYEVPWLLGPASPEPLAVWAYRLFTDIELSSRSDAFGVAALTTCLALVPLLVAAIGLRRLERLS